MSTTTLHTIHHDKPCSTLVSRKHRKVGKVDSALVALSSVFFLGGVVWVPCVYIWLYKKWRNTPEDTEENKKKRKRYRNLLISATLIALFGPHRHKRVGEFLNVRRSRILEAWLNFLSFEVISEVAHDSKFNLKKDQGIFAVVPHGIVPFSLAFATGPQSAVDTIGGFRPVVASATRLLPLLRTLMEWVNCVDASKLSVEKTLRQGDRIGLSPGGIAEMFEGYPKIGRSPDEECALLNSRKGFVKLALKHRLPLIPIYCFGASKMFKRLQLPPTIEKISNYLRIAFVIFFGKFGLPIPFQQPLKYIVGDPIFPESFDKSMHEDSDEFRDAVDRLHSHFCNELVGMFERHKCSYGWNHKTLRIV